MDVQHKTRDQMIDQLNQKLTRLTRLKNGVYGARLDALDMTLLQYGCLQAIEQLGPGVSIGEIGEEIGAGPSTMTSLTSRLVALGFIERYTPPDNRRVVLLKSTEAGSRVVYEFQCEEEVDMVALFAAMTDDMIATVNQLLAALLENAERLHASRSSRPAAGRHT